MSDLFLTMSTRISSKCSFARNIIDVYTYNSWRCSSSPSGSDRFSLYNEAVCDTGKRLFQPSGSFDLTWVQMCPMKGLRKGQENNKWTKERSWRNPPAKSASAASLFLCFLPRLSDSMNIFLTPSLLALVFSVSAPYRNLLTLFSVLAPRLRTSKQNLTPSSVSDWILKQKSFIFLSFKILPARTHSLCWQGLWKWGQEPRQFRCLVQVRFPSILEIFFRYVISDWYSHRQ